MHRMRLAAICLTVVMRSTPFAAYSNRFKHIVQLFLLLLLAGKKSATGFLALRPNVENLNNKTNVWEAGKSVAFLVELFFPRKREK